MWKIYMLATFLLIITTSSEYIGIQKKCEAKEKSLALLEMAKNSISKAKHFIPDCNENENGTQINESSCGKKEKASAYIDVALELINKAQNIYTSCDFENITEPEEEKPDDNSYALHCLEIMKRGKKKSGIYPITLFNNQTVNVFCDMETDGGGWTVIQRRGNFDVQEDFYKDWQSYKKGFGNINKDFWIGNELIHILTNEGNSTLRFDMGDVRGEKAFAVYQDFFVSNEIDGYRLNFGNYSGNAGNSLERSNGLRFSTKDKITDGDSDCPALYRGAWWYRSCALCNPNGLYNPGKKSQKNIHWNDWRLEEGLAFFEIKIRNILYL